MAVLNLAPGGTLAFVLIQEQLASLLSGTFFVPGYFHFLWSCVPHPARGRN